MVVEDGVVVVEEAGALGRVADSHHRRVPDLAALVAILVARAHARCATWTKRIV